MEVETTRTIRDNVVQELKKADLKEMNYYNSIFKINKRKLKKTDNLEIYKVRLYNHFSDKHYSKVDMIETIYKNIESDDAYNGNLFDLYLLSNIYNLGIVLMMKRRKKGERDHILIKPMEDKPEDYVLVVKSNSINRNIYETVIRRTKAGFKFAFTKKELPEDFVDYVFVKGSKISTANDEESNESNDGDAPSP